MKDNSSFLEKLISPVTELEKASIIIESASELWIGIGFFYFIISLFIFAFDKRNAASVVFIIAVIYALAGFIFPRIPSRILAIFMLLLAINNLSAAGVVILNNVVLGAISLYIALFITSIAYRALLASFCFNKLSHRRAGIDSEKLR